MKPFDWNPGSLLELSGHYWKTCTLHAGVKLDIFTCIGEKTVSCDDIAEKLNADTRGLSTLLNALSAMGFLEKTNEAYANCQAAKIFLSKDSPQYIGFMIMHHHHLMDSWQNMDKAIIQGGPIRGRASFSNDEWRENFLMGMFNIAMAVAPGLSKMLDLSGCTHLLDLGGGPGTFAIHFCLANPGIKASVYDLKTSQPFAQKTIKQFNMSDRIDFISGNYIDDETIGEQNFDAAWLSHILHGEGPEDAGNIIKKAVHALKPGSKIYIHDFFLNDEKNSPLFAALFSINMYLGTRSGRSYSQNEIGDMLKANRVRDIKRLDFEGPTQSGILCGITP